MYPFRFEYEICSEEDNFKIYRLCGLGLCESYTDAVEQIEKTEKDSLIKITCIELFEQDNLIYLPKKVIENYSQKNCPAIDYWEEVNDGK